MVDDVAPDEAGLASGLLTSSLQIGGALGLAVFVTLVGEVATINSAAQGAGTRTVLLAPRGSLPALGVPALTLIPTLRGRQRAPADAWRDRQRARRLP